MPKQAFPAAAEGMPNFNRRTFLRGMGSATAVAGVVTAPTVAEAFAAGAYIPAGALSDEQQLEACLAELKVILGRMHPIATEVSHGYYPQQDGTFRLWINCRREFLEWSGPGFYRVSDDGYIMTWWLERRERRTRSGAFIDYEYFADMYIEDEGGFVGETRRMWGPKIVEKLEGLEA